MKTTLRHRWTGRVEHDLVAAYGWTWRDAFEAHPAYFYCDLGWWDRKPHHRQISGHHRVTFSSRYEAVRSKFRFRDDRWRQLKVPILPWRQRSVRTVLVAGMSGKAAFTQGYRSHEWELETVRRLTNGPNPVKVLYRPKPGWIEAVPLPGSEWVDPATPLENILEEVDAVVVHHSNVAVDALVRGIPAYRELEAGGPFALTLEHLLAGMPEPETRNEFLYRLAYRQWTPPELALGQWLQHYHGATPASRRAEEPAGAAPN
jgi:hypothetical protein